MSDMVRNLYKDKNYYIGKYLYGQACCAKVTCIVITRWDLRKFLDVDRLDGTRRKWFQDDLKRWFPDQKYYSRSKSSSEMHSLLLSHVPIVNLSDYLSGESITTSQRVRNMNKIYRVPQVVLYNEMSCGKTHDYHKIVSWVVLFGSSFQ